MRKCTVCGDERQVTARSILETGTCISCVSKARARLSRKSPEEFKRELAEMFPNYTLLDTYTTNDAHVRVLCTLDNTEFTGTPHSLLEGHGCPECARRFQHRRTHTEFIDEMAERYPKIEVRSQFTNCATKVSFACLVCGYEWTAVPNTLLNTCRSNGCPKCCGKARVMEPEMVERLAKNNSQIEYLYGYTSMVKKAWFRCKECGNEWHAFVNNILRGRSCPVCGESYGNARIRAYLDSHGIGYIPEYKFDDCKNERPLPFDFYLPDRNCCIEYDGEQHFTPVRFGNYDQQTAERKMRECQRRDTIKNQYCIDHNIMLIRIPYTEFNKIEELLDKSLF